MSQQKVSDEVITNFLEGSSPQKYVVAIETSYTTNVAHLIINDPENGKYIEKCKFKPFLWLKGDVYKMIYGGKRTVIREAMRKYNIKFKTLRIENNEGYIPTRMDTGFKFIATSDKNFVSLQNFFKEGGMDVWDNENKNKYFLIPNLTEQFMIQTGIRLFKGYNDYNNLHRVQFDLETEGLIANTDAIFQIGIKDNRGFEHIIEVTGNTKLEREESERRAIILFFHLINELKPDIIAGYNSEFFDWDFFVRRCDKLKLDIKKVAGTLSPDNITFKRSKGNLKVGGETEEYIQTNMWGHNIVDVSHAVRRAMAIQSDMKSWSLKYVTKYSKIVKSNRVYIDGHRIHDVWADQRPYWFNEKTGEWSIILKDEETGKTNVPEDAVEITGVEIVKRYLLDDLWETEQVDKIYNQASFLLGKIVPTTFQRSSTMGSSGQWKLIMMAWSYENGLAIPDFEAKRNFVGGLSRLLKVGFAKNIAKLDYAAMYPKLQLTGDIFPDLDIMGAMKGLVQYIVETRDKFKGLTGEYKDKKKEIETKYKIHKSTLSKEEIENVEKAIKKYERLASDADKKQLPLKILANSWFGGYGAPNIFPWGETDSAEATTCRGRQALRLMVRFFHEEKGFMPLVGDTDGFNFAMPDHIDTIKYIPKCTHWKTIKYQDKNIELSGLEACVAEFNETYMEGWMGLGIDGLIDSTINIARKNYANKQGNSIKKTGNNIKSKGMPLYIEEFIDNGIRLLLEDKGKEFIEYYYEYVDRIFNYDIPIHKIATNFKVKIPIHEYQTKYCMGKQKSGRFKNRQAHMELAILHDLNVNIGSRIYYYNIGSTMSQPDIKTHRNKDGSVEKIEFNAKLVSTQEIDENPDMIVNDYNVPKYLKSFNKAISRLLVVFHPDIRDNILITSKIEKKTKLLKLEDRHVYTNAQCKLVAGYPLDPSHQDSYETDLMTMDDREIRYWTSVNEVPIYMVDESKWPEIVEDYNERLRIARLEGIDFEKAEYENIAQRIDVSDIMRMETYHKLPKSVETLADLEEDGILISKKWGVEIGNAKSLLEFRSDAEARHAWYLTIPAKDRPKKDEKDKIYEMWRDHVVEIELMGRSSASTETVVVETSVENVIEENKPVNTVFSKVVELDDDDDDYWGF